MKKRTIWISFLLVLVTLLTSCAGLVQKLPAPTTPRGLESRVEMVMESIKSYRIDMKMEYVGFVGSTRMSGKMTGIVIEDQGKDGQGYYAYTDMTNNTSADGMSIRVRNVEAYHEGYAYSWYSEGAGARKLYSKMSEREYRKYIENTSPVDLGLEDCENVAMEQTEQGYLLTYSGYSAEATKQFSLSMGFSADMFLNRFEDMIMTLEVDKDYRPVKMTLEMVFEQTSNYYMPKMLMSMEFSEFDAVERITKTIDPDDYFEIEDLGLLKELQDMVDGKLDAKELHFETTAKQKVKLLSQSQSITSTAKGSFANDKKIGFTFEADVDTGDGSGEEHVTYREGKRKEGTDGHVRTEDMSETEARAYIMDLINDPSLGYNAKRVSKIEKTDTGYLVTMITSGHGYIGQVINATGASYTSGEHTVELVFEKGKIVAINSEFSGKGNVSGGYGQSATLYFDGSWKVAFTE